MSSLERQATVAHFQEVVDAVERLPDCDQALLIQIVYEHLTERRRAQLLADVAEAREACQTRCVRRGDLTALLEALDE